MATKRFLDSKSSIRQSLHLSLLPFIHLSAHLSTVHVSHYIFLICFLSILIVLILIVSLTIFKYFKELIYSMNKFERLEM